MGSLISSGCLLADSYQVCKTSSFYARKVYLCFSSSSLDKRVSPALGITWSNQLLMRLMVSRTPQAENLQRPALQHPGGVRTLRVAFAPHLPLSFCLYTVNLEGVKGVSVKSPLWKCYRGSPPEIHTNEERHFPSGIHAGLPDMYIQYSSNKSFLWIYTALGWDSLSVSSFMSMNLPPERVIREEKSLIDCLHLCNCY